MLRACCASVVSLVFAGCSSVEEEAARNPMQYGCNDLVVVGRLTTVASELIDNPADLLGQSAWDAEINIKRVLRGAERRDVVRAVGASHAEVRDDVDLLIVLARSEDSRTYGVKTLTVWKGKSQLAESCSELPT